MNSRAITLLVFALALMAVPLGRAQQHAQPAQPAAQTTPAPAPSTPAPTQPAHQASSDPEKALVEASKEAETGKAKHGEEDEEAQFKYSTMVQKLANHTGLSVEAAYWLSIILNFIALGTIGWIITFKTGIPGMFGPLPPALKERGVNIKRQLEEARAASEHANQRLAEIESRLARIDTEIVELRAAGERDAAAEEQRLRAAAEADRAKIVASAEQDIATAAKGARAELKRYTAELAIGLAEKKIQVTPQTDQALVRGFADELSSDIRVADTRASDIRATGGKS